MRSRKGVSRTRDGDSSVHTLQGRTALDPPGSANICFAAMVTRARFHELIDSMQGRLILVYGDIVADQFIYGSPKRISREAPVLILRRTREDVLLGGGGNSIQNIASLGGLPIPIGVLGADSAGQLLLETMASQGIECGGILRLDRYNTPTKVRVLGGMPHATHQQIVRYDIEEWVDLTEEENEAFARLLRDQMSICDGALIADYGYGSVSSRLVSNLTGFAHGKPVTLDSRYDLLRYPDVTAATPNEEEAAAAAGTTVFEGPDEAVSVEYAAQAIQQALDAEAILITRGSRGMALYERQGNRMTTIPVHGTDQVADVTGAGDTVIATFTLALTAGASFEEAARLANYAASVVVMKMGTATVTAEELRHTIERDESL